jgi:hypothetical protein
LDARKVFMAKRGIIRNVLGLGGFQGRRHQIWVLRRLKGEVVGCGARTRAGGACGMPPCRNSNRCFHHGGAGSGRGHLSTPKNLRISRNQVLHALRLAAKTELAKLLQDRPHRDLEAAFRPYAAKIYGPNEELLKLTLLQRLAGEVSQAEVAVAVEQAMLNYRRDQVLPPSRAEQRASQSRMICEAVDDELEIKPAIRKGPPGGW